MMLQRGEQILITLPGFRRASSAARADVIDLTVTQGS